jgi:AcrR family transcriptional regulator
MSSSTPRKGKTAAVRAAKPSMKQSTKLPTKQSTKPSAQRSVNKASSPAAAPARRTQRGRPPRLSQQAVIVKTMELLEKKLPEEITLALLAKELDTATVSLYKYFPNRDAVLSAVAEHFYSLFEFPQPRRKQPWQQSALDWLWAVHRHMQRHPLASRMYGVEGQLSTAMLKMCAPATRIMEREGLRGEALAFATAWFVNHGLGLIFNEVAAGDFRQPIALRHVVDLPAEYQETYLALRPYLSAVKTADVLEFGFNTMIAGLEQLLNKNNEEKKQ